MYWLYFSSKYLAILNAHTRFISTRLTLSFRIQSQSPESEMDNYASFISEALEKTRCRECVPSWEEIQMLMSRQEMLCTVHYPGPGSCQLYISSHTTANEVWAHFFVFNFKARIFSIFQLLPFSFSKLLRIIWSPLTLLSVDICRNFISHPSVSTEKTIKKTYLVIDWDVFKLSLAMPSFSWIMKLDGTRLAVLKEPKNKLEKLASSVSFEKL